MKCVACSPARQLRDDELKKAACTLLAQVAVASSHMQHTWNSASCSRRTEVLENPGLLLFSSGTRRQTECGAVTTSGAAELEKHWPFRVVISPQHDRLGQQQHVCVSSELSGFRWCRARPRHPVLRLCPAAVRQSLSSSSFQIQKFPTGDMDSERDALEISQWRRTFR